MLIKKSTQQRWQTSKPQFQRFQIFDNDIVGVELLKSEVVLDKPIYVGVSILDFAKIHMAWFWYDVIKSKYGQKAELCFTGK